jgi:hypothetical protein
MAEGLMMRHAILLSAGLLVGLPAAALAQDHGGHASQDETAAAPARQPEPSIEPAAPDHAQMDHSRTDHSQMDHSQMDHSGMPPAPAAPAQPGHGAHAGHAAEGDTPSLAGATEGSGTARLPAAEGMMPGIHFDIGSGWQGMAHGYAWLIHTDQSGPRGDSMTHVQSMAMLTAERRFEGGRVQLRSMFSAEPLMPAHGYPNLFATGETADGMPLVDRQHPHDLFMELAARLDLDVAPGTTAFLYGGPVAEPALGPSALMHRASARLNPEAPITHHWFDSTHIAYGVVTAGLAGRAWQIEASAFRGQEPDENRWDIEAPRLDSWSVRATLTPSPNWALQVSHGRLDQPEALHPGQDEARTTASVHYASGRSAAGGSLAAMAAFSAKNRVPGDTVTAWLGEVNWDISDRHTIFGRVENVANDELFPDHDDPLHDTAFRVTKLQAGYAYTLPLGSAFQLALGGTAAVFFAPDALDGAYGDTPTGFTAFARLSLGQ